MTNDELAHAMHDAGFYVKDVYWRGPGMPANVVLSTLTPAVPNELKRKWFDLRTEEQMEVAEKMVDIERERRFALLQKSLGQAIAHAEGRESD